MQGGSEPYPSGRSLVRSKLDYSCIVYSTASNTNLRQLDSVHNSGLRLALRAFCTSPISSLYTVANEAPLEERRLKLSMHYYLTTRACTDNPSHHALHECDQTIRDLYAPGQMGEEAPAISLKVEATKTSADINAELVYPLGTPSLPPGRSRQMYDLHTRSPGQIQWVTWVTGIT